MNKYHHVVNVLLTETTDKTNNKELYCYPGSMFHRWSLLVPVYPRPSASPWFYPHSPPLLPLLPVKHDAAYACYCDNFEI